jgi:hypothetical protein
VQVLLEFLSFLVLETLCATNKPVADRLRSEALPDAAMGHFGSLRGLDCYNGLGAVVVAGREQPSAQAAEDWARSFYGDDSEPLTILGTDGQLVGQCRPYRMRDGTFAGAVVEVHPDPRVQGLIEQMRECESVQAIARLRPFHRANPILAAALGKPIHGFRIEGAEHAEEFATGGTGDRTAECDAAPLDDQPCLRPLEQALVKSGGALPLSGKWLSETQPDLFGSRATAERAVSEFWAALENGEEWATVVADHYCLANYKLKSGPGRPAHAIMRKDFAASADALEFVLGCEVHGFRVVPWRSQEVDAPSPEADLPDACAPTAPWVTFPLRLDPKRMIKRVLDGVIGKPPADLSAEGLEVVGSVYQGSAERIIMEIGYVTDEYPEYLTPGLAELLNLTARP